MNDEQLATLGVSLQRDFQVLMQGYITGWLDENYLTGEDVRELSAIAWDINRIFQVNEQVLDLEQRLSSGFVPEDLALQNAESGGMETETIAPGSSWFSEPPLNSSPNPFSPPGRKGAAESALLPSITPLKKGGRGDREGMGMKSFNDGQSNGLDLSDAAQLQPEYPQGKISISAPPASEVDKAVYTEATADLPEKVKTRFAQTIGYPAPSESFPDGVAEYEDDAYGEAKMSTLENECDRPNTMQRSPMGGLKALASFIASEYPDGVFTPEETHISKDSPAAESISSIPSYQKKYQLKDSTHDGRRQNPQLDSQKSVLTTSLDEQLSFQSQGEAAEDLTLSPLSHFEQRNNREKDQVLLAASPVFESRHFSDSDVFSSIESTEEEYISVSEVQRPLLRRVKGNKALSEKDWTEKSVVLPRESENVESQGVDKGEILANQEAIAFVNATEETLTIDDELSGLDMDLIMQAITREVEREYKRFYGDS